MESGRIKTSGGRNKYRVEAHELEEFIRSVAVLEGTEEIRDFLNDLLTERERADLVRRFHAARLLADGKKYGEIMFYAHMSPPTIARIAEVLDSGTGILQKLFGRVEKVAPKPSRRSPDPDTIGRYLRRRIQKGK